MKKLLFIINPKAGLKKNKHFIDESVEIFENAGYKVGIKFTKKRLDGTNIAKEYSKKGENGNSIGFNLQNSKTNKSEIYYPPIAYSDDDNYYVAQSYFEPGDVITKSDSHSSYVVERTRDFMGVYNINNGYTVFTIVNILDTLDEYYIVANETSGLEIYDRIVLDASKVSENQIIFQ